MPVLVPGIHENGVAAVAWMAGTSPAGRGRDCGARRRRRHRRTRQAGLVAALGPRPHERGSQARTRPDVIGHKPKAILFDLLTALLDSWTLWDAVAGKPADGRRWRAA